MSTQQCQICHERSAWEFLGDFYSRVQLMSEHSRTLERKLDEALRLVNQSQCALTECETSLVNSWGTLNEERLEYRACQEALNFERQSHIDTIAFLDQVFKEATRSTELVDSLANQVEELQSASNFRTTYATPPAILSDGDTTPPKDDTLPCQQIVAEEESVVQLSGFNGVRGCGVGTANHVQTISLATQSFHTEGKIRSKKSKPRRKNRIMGESAA